MFWKQKVVEKRTVLFVDDDEAILNSLRRGLLDETYDKIFSASCKEALEIMQQKEVHVIVTDMRMPEMSGLEFLRKVKEEHPYVVAIVLSGYNHDPELRAAVDRNEVFTLISKPWKLGGNFERIVRGALDHYNVQNKSGHSGGGKSRFCKAGLK